jgi:hypothetical protein
LSVDCLSRAVAARNRVAAKFDCNLFEKTIKIHRTEEIISNLDALPEQSRLRVDEKAQQVTLCKRMGNAPQMARCEAQLN